MVIEFYQFEPSPPCRMVRMTLKALGLEVENKSINLMKGETQTPEFLAINPRGKIPALKDGDYIVTESRAIATYLCNQYEKGEDKTRLYPVEPKARGRVDQLLYVSENISDMIMSYVNVGGVLFGNATKPNEEKIPEVKKALQLCEGYLTKSEYIAADHLTLADFFMASPLIMLALPGYNDFADFSKTRTWLAKIKALPYYEDVNKTGLATITEMYRSKMK